MRVDHLDGARGLVGKAQVDDFELVAALGVDAERAGAEGREKKKPGQGPGCVFVFDWLVGVR